MNTYEPDYAIHPGEYLEEVLGSREIKKKDFAQRAGISPKAVSQIINGKSLYSTELALDFERILGIKAEIWINLANTYQLRQVKVKEELRLANESTRNWLKRFPVTDLRKLGIVTNSRKPQELAESILRFLGVSSPEACSEWIGNRAVAFRKSSAYTESDEATSIWLKLAEGEAATMDIPVYNRETFKKQLEDVRTLTVLSFADAIAHLRRRCAEAGVCLVIIPKLAGIRLSGASWWLGNDRPVLALSLRYGTNDHFWFTFYHEAAHILLHGKKGIFLDSQDGNDTPDEQEANAYARNSLIAPGAWAHFIAGVNFYESAIKAFAVIEGIHPAIVVGRLQHEGRIEKNWHNGLKESVSLPHMALLRGFPEWEDGLDDDL